MRRSRGKEARSAEREKITLAFYFGFSRIFIFFNGPLAPGYWKHGSDHEYGILWDVRV